MRSSWGAARTGPNHNPFQFSICHFQSIRLFCTIFRKPHVKHAHLLSAFGSCILPAEGQNMYRHHREEDNTDAHTVAS